MTVQIVDTKSEAEKEQEAALLAKIERGEKLEANDPLMTADYRENLLNLMTMQADSELSGGYGYIPWISKAPTIEEKLLVSGIVRDEVLHAKRMYKLLEELGVDVDSRIHENDEAFLFRTSDGDGNIGTQRLAKDKRVNIFYYPIDTWMDFIMFNFCMDRGAGHQLEDAVHCSYGPWVRVQTQIFKEEVVHIAHGEKWVELLAKDPATHEECQQTFNKWFLRTMNIFGRPGSSRNAIYRKYRLKIRDNDEVREAFRLEVAALCAKFGLTVPDWHPS
jgi:ring-1,2-phenylacetyl-CoA epoxidase subunit PaaA